MAAAEEDHFDRLPDSILLLLFNSIADVKSLARCSLVSRRFHSLIPHVHNLLVRVDCVISDDDSSSSSATDKSRGPFSALFRSIFFNILKPLAHLLLAHKTHSSSSSQQDLVTHHSPTQVLKNFNDVRFLRIQLPSGELGIEDGVLLKWRAEFGSTLDNCVILGASSCTNNGHGGGGGDGGDVDDSGSIPDSFYTNGGLKLRVVWTISSLIAASARHYLVQPIISEHTSLDSLVLTDGDGQGVLCMNRDQLQELRVKPLSASSASKRTLVPALNMRLWYAPQLELPHGLVLKGATLVAISPIHHSHTHNNQPSPSPSPSHVSMAFEEPYSTAARMLLNRRTYSLEMNSF